jgi:hypothetical protein
MENPDAPAICRVVVLWKPFSIKSFTAASAIWRLLRSLASSAFHQIWVFHLSRNIFDSG